MSAKQFAKQFYDAFTTDERNEPNEYGDKRFYKLADHSPQWMTDALLAAHDTGDILPNDWVYENCYYILERMVDTDEGSWDDSVSEWADSLVDVYNADRSRWLASNLHFAGVIDEAVEELGHSDQGIHGDIGIGQYRFLEQIAAALIWAVMDQAESTDDA